MQLFIRVSCCSLASSVILHLHLISTGGFGFDSSNRANECDYFTEFTLEYFLAKSLQELDPRQHMKCRIPRLYFV